MKNIIFLYSKQSGYLRSCLKELSADHNVLLVYWEAVKEAPFQFKNDNSFQEIPKSSLSYDSLLKYCLDFQPDIVFLSGWMDRDYMKIAKRAKRTGSKVIMGIDNPWKETWRQKIGVTLLKGKLRRTVDYLWVAGREQQDYGYKLGFSKEQIIPGLYCADVEKFLPVAPSYEKILLYAGRLLAWKGVSELVDAFNLLSDSEKNGWKLKIAGNGPLKEHVKGKRDIDYLGFVQPEQLPKTMEKVGAFVLPSHDEHWGVIVHEAATAGLPVVLSNKVRSAEIFLLEGTNGFSFTANNLMDLKSTLIQLFKCDRLELIRMGTISKNMGKSYTTKDWCKNLTSILE